ncbi:MAG: hypothetical protein ABI639_06050 [Thermoanaerobaculia bacterium]
MWRREYFRQSWEATLPDSRAQLDIIVAALQALAAEPEVQVDLFPDFVVVPDELASTYSDAYGMVDKLFREGLVSPAQANALASVEAVLERMSQGGDKGLWTVEGLRLRDEWRVVRSKALSALQELDIPPEAPSLAGTSYV